MCLFFFPLRRWIPTELAPADEDYSVSQGQCQDLKPELKAMPRKGEGFLAHSPGSPKQVGFSIMRYRNTWKLKMRTEYVFSNTSYKLTRAGKY